MRLWEKQCSAAVRWIPLSPPQRHTPEPINSKQHKAYINYQGTLSQHVTRQFELAWQQAISKTVISASSAQHGVLNDADHHAEYWTASILQPQKWNHHVNHWWQTLSNNLDITIEQTHGATIEEFAQVFWQMNQDLAAQDCMETIVNLEQTRVATNLLLCTDCEWRM